MPSEHDNIIKLNLNTIRLNIINLGKIHYVIFGPAGTGPAKGAPTPLYYNTHIQRPLSFVKEIITSNFRFFDKYTTGVQ